MQGQHGQMSQMMTMVNPQMMRPPQCPGASSCAMATPCATQCGGSYGQPSGTVGQPVMPQPACLQPQVMAAHSGGAEGCDAPKQRESGSSSPNSDTTLPVDRSVPSTTTATVTSQVSDESVVAVTGTGVPSAASAAGTA